MEATANAVMSESGVPLSSLVESAIIARAAELARDGRYEQAIQLLHPLTEGSSVRNDAIELLAKIHAQQQHWGEAGKLWKRALQNDPLNEHFQRAALRCEQMGGSRSLTTPGLLPLLLVMMILFFVALLFNGQRRLEQQLQALNVRTVTVGNPANPTNSPSVATSVANLTDAVKQALAADKLANSLALDIKQTGDVINITGQAPNLSTRYHIEKLVRNVPGVKLINLNNLSIAQTYTVKPGDNLWDISVKLYGSAYPRRSLAKANGMKSPYLLEAGQVLKVPQPDPSVGP